MRIVYIADVRLPIERANGIQTVETLHALARRGHAVTLLCRPDTESPARDPLAYYGLPAIPTLSIVRLRVRGRDAMKRVQFLLGALAWSMGRATADAIMTRDLGVASAVLRLPRRTRPPVVYESHGFAPTVSAEMSNLLSTGHAATARKQARLLARERHVWMAADGYVTLTMGLLAELRERFGDRPHALVVPDGTRLPERVEVPALRQGPPVVGYAGHLYPWKGVDVLVDALAAVPGAKGLVIGGHPKEPDLPRLRARAAELGLTDRITFTGHIAPGEVRGRLSAADILVLPNRRSQMSTHYTSPLKLFEYLSLAKPIVASDLPSLREILTPEVTAVMVPPDDPGALAAALRRLMDAPEQARALGERAGALAAQFSWDTRAARLEALFSSVVTAHS